MSNRDIKRKIPKGAKVGDGEGDGLNIHSNETSTSQRQNHEAKGGDASTKPLIICGRGGCINAAIVHPGWDGDFCSRDCALIRCHEVFFRWVTSQKNGAKYNN